MRLLFFGSSNYCIPVLTSLYKNFQLIAIITKQNSAAQQFAKSHNIQFFTPKDKKELLHLISQIRQIRPDLAIVADYGLIIPQEIFEIPKYKTLNIHFSRLPDLRGPSPVQYTILRGDKSAWITVIIMAKEMDTGDIIWQKEVPLTSGKSTNYPIIQLSNYPINETSESLYEKLFNIAATELPSIIKKYRNNELKPQKQDHKKATYTKILTREDGFIPPRILESAMKGLSPDKRGLNNWQLAIKIPQLPIRQLTDQLPIIIERAIRALYPWPGVWTYIKLRNNKFITDRGDRLYMLSGDNKGLKRLKILKAHLEQSTIRQLADQQLTILILDLVQLEGKKPVSWKQFLAGYPDFSL